MKVFEILRNDVPPMTEEQVIARLKAFDWSYEFSDDFRRQAHGRREMEILENLVYRLWKQNPENAVRIWNEHCPYVSEDRNTTPSFIFSLQYQDEIAAANK